MRSGFLDTYSRKWVSNTTLHSFSAGIAVVPRVLGIALEVIRAALNFAQQASRYRRRSRVNRTIASCAQRFSGAAREVIVNDCLVRSRDASGFVS